VINELTKNLKEKYQPGISVRLISMHREPQMPEGLNGKIKHVDDEGQIHVLWENGSSLALNYGIDKFVAFEGLSIREYLIEKLNFNDDTKIWYRENNAKHTINAIEAVGINELTKVAELFINNNISMTKELAVLMGMIYEISGMVDVFLSAHVLSDEEIQQLKDKTNFSKDESEEGYCPKCGSSDLDYGSFEVDGSSISYPWTCEQCGSEGNEFGEIAFDGHIVDHICLTNENKEDLK